MEDMQCRKESLVKVAGAQYRSVVGGKKENLAKAIELIHQAADQGVKIICFPELFYTSYFLDKETFHEVAEPADGDLYKQLSVVAKELDMVIVMGFPERGSVAGEVFNSMLVIDADGSNLGTMRKVYLWGEEQLKFTSGRDLPVFRTKYGNVGILVCFDMDYLECFKGLAYNQAEIVFGPSVWSFECLYRWHVDLKAGAIANLMYTFGVNPVEDGCCGSTALYSPYGELLSSADEYEEKLVIGEMNLDFLKSERVRYPIYRDFRPEIFGEINKIVQAKG